MLGTPFFVPVCGVLCAVCSGGCRAIFVVCGVALVLCAVCAVVLCTTGGVVLCAVGSVGIV